MSGMDVNIGGANVNAVGDLKTALTNNPLYIGGVRLFTENDPGAIMGTPYLKSPETSLDFRLRVGVDSVWDNEVFNYTAQNYNKHKYTSNTLTVTWTGGFVNTNGAGVTTTATGCQMQTYRPFPVNAAGVLYFEQGMALSNAPVTNWTLDFGGVLLAAASTSLPLDGVYFRINSTGVFGVANNNGTEHTTAVFDFTPGINIVNKYTISVSDSEVEFWINDILYGRLDKPNNAGNVFYSGSLPWGFRHHHTGVTSAIISAKFSNYTVSMGDVDNSRLWATSKAGQGLSGVQYPSGGTAGQTTNGVNSTVPATATLSNTAASYTTLGGKFVFAAVVGAETDYALFAFQVPAAAANLMGRSLVIRGVWIDTYNTGAAVTGTPTVIEWSLAVGCTAQSLATADSATARMPKRIPLGVQTFTVGTLVGAAAPRIDVNLDAPLPVEPGTQVHVIMRVPFGAATASEFFRGQVGINAYWE